ncbi:unnamed protein product [Urochloa humidicola]
MWRITTNEQLDELELLWSKIGTVQLNDSEDIIRWKWTANGEYSSKSAYNAQLAGSHSTFNTKALWTAKTEGKHKVFAWLLLHQGILTADRLTARRCQCDPWCSLCDQVHETAQHISLQCVYAQQVWVLVVDWCAGLVQLPQRDLSIEDWWNQSLEGTPRETKRQKAAIMIYTVWNIWKERNRRIFEHKAATPQRVLALIKEEMSIKESASAVFLSPIVS